jgi:hypothetical protein
MGSWIHGRIGWLRENGSWPLLVAIVVLATVSTMLIDDEGVARPVTLVAMALLGVALVLGCLFAFPYAGVWRDEAAASQAAAQSAAATEEQQKFDRLSSSADLMGSGNAGIRLVGVASLSKLIDDQGVDPAEGYRALAVFVKDSKSTRWTSAKRAYWDGFVDRDAKLRTGDPPRTGENDLLVGVGSLRKRTPDVQSALSVIASGKHRPPGYRADLRDASLQGVALGHAWLPEALFDGAHLDHLDVRTNDGPYANFAKAEFKGAKLDAAYFHNAELGEAHFDPPHARQITDLRYAQFRGASAVGAHFEGANLGNAVFTSFKARRTILREAHFNSRAELRTNLKGAVLQQVNFDWATLAGVTYDPRTTWPAGFYAPSDRTVLE